MFLTIIYTDKFEFLQERYPNCQIFEFEMGAGPWSHFLCVTHIINTKKVTKRNVPLTTGEYLELYPPGV